MNSFGTYMGRATNVTRAGSAGVITTEKLKLSDYNFGVLSYNTGATDWAGASNAVIPNFMYNEKIYWDGSNWKYDNIKYWPNDYAGNGGYVDEKTTGESGATGTTQTKLSFFAYAPWVEFDYDQATPGSTEVNSVTRSWLDPDPNSQDYGIKGMTSNNQTSEPYIKYTLKSASSDEAVDLLWGMRGNTTGYDIANGSTESTIGAYNTNLVKQTVDERVNFLFKHALAKMAGHNSTSTTGGEAQTGLQVVLDIDKDGAITGGEKADATLVTVNSVQVRTILPSDGLNLNETDGADGSNLATDGWFNIADGKWYNVSIKQESNQYDGATYNSGETKVNSTGTMGKLNADIAEPAAHPTYTSSSWSMAGVTTTPKDVYTDDSDVPAIFMIPNADVDQTLLVKITYTVRTYDSHLATTASGEDGTWTKVAQTITNTVTIPKGKLAPNKYYKLLMHLGLTSIKFTASVSDWEAATNTDSDNDGTPDDLTDADKDIYLPSNVVSRELAGIEDAAYSVDVRATTPSVDVPASTSSFTLALLNLPALGESATVSAGTFTDPVTNVAVDRNGRATVTITPNTTSAAETTGSFKLTWGTNEYTINVVQKMGMTASFANIAAGATTTTTLTATVNGQDVASNNTMLVSLKDENGTAVEGTLASGTLTLTNANTSSKIKTYIAEVKYTDTNSKEVTTTTAPFTHAAGIVTATASPTTGLKATVAANRVVTVTVTDAASTNINLLTADKVIITVDNTTSGTATDATALCTITKTTTGCTVLLPVNNSGAEAKFKVNVTVNDAAKATTAEITQSTAD